MFETEKSIEIERKLVIASAKESMTIGRKWVLTANEYEVSLLHCNSLNKFKKSLNCML